MTEPEAPRRRRLGRWILLATGLLVGGATLPWWGESLAFFRVHQLVVRGARYANVDEIHARSTVDSTWSVWGPLDSIEARVERHPQVREARVRRRLPNMLILEIEEEPPVALIPGPRGLRVYDENGRVLPIDLTRTPADLPIAERADTALLHLLADLSREQPALFARVSEVRLQGRREFRFILNTLPVLVRRGQGVERFEELSSVERDLAQRGIVPVELDLRFKDQVIARLP